MALMSEIQRGTHAEIVSDPVAAGFFDASDDCVKLVALDGSLLAMNANGLCLLEIDDFDDVRARPWTSLWPERHRAVIEAAMADALAGRGARFSADCPTAKGTMKSWDVVVWPILDSSGRPTQLVSISRDVTERLRVEEENFLLARELVHRIKNMFAVVDGVISMSARAAPASKPFAAALRERLQGLSRALAYVAPPELIGQDGSNTKSLHELFHVLLTPYGDTEGVRRQVIIAGNDAPVGRTATTSLALAINELATNALKYGALSGREGRVTVTTHLTAEGMEIVWREEVAPPWSKPLEVTEGFGATLLHNAVVRQLGGVLSREWIDNGLVVRMLLSPEILGR